MGGTPSSLSGNEGYHVLAVEIDSPADLAGLEPYFDFVIGINDVALIVDDSTFHRILRAHLEQKVILKVYSIKSRTKRDVVIVPSDKWNGEGVIGAAIRFCSWKKVSEAVWHVTHVHPTSPAEKAGLISGKDYIIGSPEGTVLEEQELYNLIERFLEKEMEIYVYNSELDEIRVVTITPSKSWGGEGSLGCDIGFGPDHQIPESEPRSPLVEYITDVEGDEEEPLSERDQQSKKTEDEEKIPTSNDTSIPHPTKQESEMTSIEISKKDPSSTPDEVSDTRREHP